MSNDNTILERITKLEEVVERCKLILGTMEERVFGLKKDCHILQRVIELEECLKINHLNKPTITSRLDTISSRIYNKT